MLILASASPRRADLLRAADISFEVETADVDETLRANEPPDAYVLRIARDKAFTVGRRKPGNLILAADTTVAVEGQILGKPTGDENARMMLKTLSGRVHTVLTGVVVRQRGREWTAVVRTEVRFLPLTDTEINWYIASGEPRDKAGAYAIQGRASRFIDRIDGSYSNVVGLPVATVCDLLRQAGGL